jgi:myotubularin-related protein 3/4
MDGSPPASMWMVRAAELFPKPILEKEDEKLTIPFSECKYFGKKKY